MTRRVSRRSSRPAPSPSRPLATSSETPDPVKGSAPLELWRLDEDADLTGPCQDTDAQSGPWAVGAARTVRNDNDLDVSGTRSNAFGERLVGTATDADGAVWHVSGHVRLLITRDGEFRFLNENVTLSRGG